MENAKFLYFRESGKFYTDARGIVPRSCFLPYLRDQETLRSYIAAANGGTMPGLSSLGLTMLVVVCMDDDSDMGWPFVIRPQESRDATDRHQDHHRRVERHRSY